MPWKRQPEDMRSIRKALVGDSRERERLMAKLVKLIREDERERVLGIRDRVKHAS